MDRRGFMAMCGITLLVPMSGIGFGSSFPRTRFYLNGQVFRDYPKDFADDPSAEESLTEIFKDHREKQQQYGTAWGDEICLGHSSLGHGNDRVSKDWTGDALFIKKDGQRDFRCDDSDLTLIDGKIWLVEGEVKC